MKFDPFFDTEGFDNPLARYLVPRPDMQSPRLYVALHKRCFEALFSDSAQAWFFTTTIPHLSLIVNHEGSRRRRDYYSDSFRNGAILTARMEIWTLEQNPRCFEF
ncbi:hypothetical protein PM082_024840 [Marasmius tenuissimus]|nr:hypothetical protein PM082_024840 [Marasmius tenuissimus]